jgi:hypothetical protein
MTLIIKKYIKLTLSATDEITLNVLVQYIWAGLVFKVLEHFGAVFYRLTIKPFFLVKSEKSA